MIDAFNWIQSQVKENQFLVAAMGSGVIYTVVAYLRYLWGKVSQAFSFFFTRKVTCQQDEEFYLDFVRFIGKSVKKPRSVKVVKASKEITSVIGVGNHWFFYGYSFIYANISQETKAGTDKPIEQISIVIYAWNPEKTRDSIIQSFKTNEKDGIKIFVSSYEYGGYEEISVKAKRDINSLFMKDSIISNVKNIISSYEKTDKYKKFNIQKKLGLIFHGPPGTGKSSLIKAIATMTGRDLYYFPTEESKVNGAITNCRYIDRPIVLAIEDIDCLSESVKNRDSSKSDKKIFNLSTLLSFLDGQNLPEDVIIIATTNKIKELDPALIRPGRFDYLLEIEQADDIIARRMVETLAPEKAHILSSLTYPISQAEIQVRLLEHDHQVV